MVACCLTSLNSVPWSGYWYRSWLWIGMYCPIEPIIVLGQQNSSTVRSSEFTPKIMGVVTWICICWKHKLASLQLLLYKTQGIKSLHSIPAIDQAIIQISSCKIPHSVGYHLIRVWLETPQGFTENDLHDGNSQLLFQAVKIICLIHCLCIMIW